MSRSLHPEDGYTMIRNNRSAGRITWFSFPLENVIIYCWAVNEHELRGFCPAKNPIGDCYAFICRSMDGGFFSTSISLRRRRFSLRRIAISISSPDWTEDSGKVTRYCRIHRLSFSPHLGDAIITCLAANAKIRYNLFSCKPTCQRNPHRLLLNSAVCFAPILVLLLRTMRL